MNECTLYGAPGATHIRPANDEPYCNEQCDVADNSNWEPNK